jgi:hypothetical protein
VNEQSANFAGGQATTYPLVAPEGGKEPLLAEMAPFSMGSDHQVYTDSSFGIPAIYLNDWPDRYIHTNVVTPAHIYPTTLKRAAFIGATSALFLANASARDADAILRLLQAASLRRTATLLSSRAVQTKTDWAGSVRHHLWYERAIVDSMDRFFRVPGETRVSAKTFLDDLEKLTGPVGPTPAGTGDQLLVFRRRAELKGPMTAFGYDYFTDHYGVDKEANLRLLSHRALRGSGSEYAYEVLTLVDGRRNALQIRDTVAGTYGPIPTEYVIEYLKALESIRVIERVK